MKDAKINLLIPPLLVIVMFFWGGSFIAIKVGLDYLTPLELVFARFLPSALILSPLGLIIYYRQDPQFKILRNLGWKNYLTLLLASFFAVPSYHFSLNYGETLIPAGWASLVISLNPACITIFAAFILRERVSMRTWLGLVISLGGLVFISITSTNITLENPLDNGGDPLQSLLGIAITLMAVVSWGGFVVLSKKLMTSLPPLTVLGITMAVGTLMMVPVASRDFGEKCLMGDFDFWGSVVFLSIGCTVISFIIWFWVLNKWRASRAGMFIYLVPLFAVLMGYFYLNEPITHTLWIGAIIVLGGVILAGRSTETKLEQDVIRDDT